MMPKNVSRLLILFFLTATILSRPASATWEDDKRKHAMVGTAIYGLCVGIGYLFEDDRLNYKTCLIPVGVAAVAKESYDRRGHGTPEWKDIGATIALPVAIAGVTYTIYEW